MSEKQPSGKRKKTASARLADELNDGEFILSTHRNARFRAIEDEHTRRVLLEATPADCASNPYVASTGRPSTLVTPDLSRTSSTADINKSDALGTELNSATSEAGASGM